MDKELMKAKNIDLLVKNRLKVNKIRTRTHKFNLGKSIDQRPKEVEEREEFGYWEIETVIGKRASEPVIMTLIERKTRYDFLFLLGNKTSGAISRCIDSLKEQHKNLFFKIFKTITADNGSEFSELSDKLAEHGDEAYFAHPYSSWKRGTNEIDNGIIKCFIPKGQTLKNLSAATIARIQNWMNNLPRKILGYMTPEKCFKRELATLHTV